MEGFPGDVNDRYFFFLKKKIIDCVEDVSCMLIGREVSMFFYGCICL